MRLGAPRPPLLSSLAHADVAQLVEHNLAKVGVAGSNPVVRSRTRRSRFQTSPVALTAIAQCVRIRLGPSTSSLVPSDMGMGVDGRPRLGDEQDGAR